MYEVQSRSVSEHEAFSFNIERENLRFLTNSHRTYLEEMNRLNDIEDQRAHANLAGAVFKRKPLTVNRFTGLASFGLAGIAYAYFPLLASTVGYSTTLFGISAASFYGMLRFREQSIVNSITLIREGEHQGKVKINVSSSLLTSRDIIADVQNTQSLYSLSTPDYDDNEVDSNVIAITNYLDCSSNKTVDNGCFVLPAEAWKDFNQLDWVLSVKNPRSDDSTQLLFDDLMQQNYQKKVDQGGLSAIQYLLRNGSNADRIGETSIDRQIESQGTGVDANIEKMIDQYGDQALRDMSPTEFYARYKQFASTA